MEEELGDMLMQVLFNIHMEEEAGRFTTDDVTDHVVRKLIFRHPHVFASGKADNSDEVLVRAKCAAHRQDRHMCRQLSQDNLSYIPSHCKAFLGNSLIFQAFLAHMKNAGELFAPDTFEPMAGALKAKTAGVIKALCLHVAHTCNLNCSYCFASQGKYHGDRALMSFEVGKQALDFLVAHSGSRHNLEVDFFGGEPARW